MKKLLLLLALTLWYHSYHAQTTYTVKDTDVTIVNGSITSYQGPNNVSLIIPNSLRGQKIISIGRSAFFSKGLTSITLPNSLTSISSNAFARNELAQINIPNTVTAIGDSAFQNNLLTQINIPNTVTSIGRSAFQNNQLTQINIPNSVTSIGNGAFVNNKLTQINIPNTVTTIGSFAFQSNQLTQINIPNSVITIGFNSFANNPIKEANINSRIIPQNMFKNFKSITKLTLGDNLEIIGVDAFTNNPIEEVSINTKNIPRDLFNGFGSISKLTLGDKVETIGVNAFENNPIEEVNINTKIILRNLFFNFSSITKLTLGNKVETISDGAFANNQLTQINIPNSVTTIGNSAFENNQLTQINIPNSVTTIGNSAFENNQLTQINIPNSITTISANIFANNKLTQITLPESITSIGSNAFLNNNLPEVKLPISIEKIEERAFKNNLLTKFTLPTKKRYNIFWNNRTIKGGATVSNLDINYTRTSISLAEDGLYVGVVGFNGSLNTSESIATEGMLRLNNNRENANKITRFIQNLRQADNTALYSAMGKSINILETTSTPVLDEVFVITFTDGLDNFSQNLTPTYNSQDIQSLLTDTKIDTKKIQSFTIGFTKGMSPAIKQAFENDLKNLASSPDNFFVSDDFNEISDYFSFISKQLVKITEVNELTCKIPGPADNTKIRWTFDTSGSNIEDAEVYIDATVRRDGLRFWLENVTYNGINSSTPVDRIPGTNVTNNGQFDGVNFAFKNFTFKEACSGGDVSLLKYWSFNPNFNLWVNDIESNAGTITAVGFNRKNIAVMLNLDSSSSLGNQFTEVKSTANNFITNLQTNYFTNSTPKKVVRVSVFPREKGIPVTFAEQTKTTNAIGEAYFFDLDKIEYNYSSTHNGVTKTGVICVENTTDISINFDANNTHTVTFEDWDGTVLKTEFVQTNGTAVAPENPKREEYEFTGWSPSDLTNIVTNTTFVAQYSKTLSTQDITKNLFTVYPNPTNGNLFIKNKQEDDIKNIFIYNTLGKLIKQVDKQEILGKEIISLDFNYPTGFYYMIINSAKSRTTIKVLKN